MGNLKLSDLRDVSTLEDLKDFIKDSKSDLDYLNQYEGLDNFLGSGTKGKVWKIKGKELVIKVTNDQDEMDISNKLKGGDTKGFLKIYYTSDIPGYQLKVQEMCYPVKKPFLHSPLYPFLYYELKNNTDIDEFLVWLRKKGKDIESVDLEVVSSYLDLSKRVYEDCEDKGIVNQYEYLDVHKDNVMESKDGTLKLVDF